MGDGIRLKLDVLDQGSGRILNIDRQGVGILRIGQFSWTSYVYHPLSVKKNPAKFHVM